VVGILVPAITVSIGMMPVVTICGAKFVVEVKMSVMRIPDHLNGTVDETRRKIVC